MVQHSMDENRLTEVDSDDHLIPRSSFSDRGILNLEASFIVYSIYIATDVTFGCLSVDSAGAKVEVIDQVVRCKVSIKVSRRVGGEG